MIVLPGQSRLFKRIVDDLAANITAIVLIPDSTDWQEAEYLLEEALIEQADYLLYHSLVLADCEDQSPVLNLSEVFQLEWPDKNLPRTVQNLLINGGLPEAIFLRTFSAIPSQHRANWLECLIDFNRISLKDRIKCPAFCVLVPASDQLASHLLIRPGFNIYYWYNFSSLAEAESFYQREAAGQNMVTAMWESSLLASLVGARYDLAEKLVGVLDKDLFQLMDRLAAIAGEVGWDERDLQKEDLEYFLNGHCYTPMEEFRLDSGIRRLWALGLMEFSAEFGWEVPSWVLAALGLSEEVKHRIWRAQVKLAMPKINQLRLKVIQTLVEGHGCEWLEWDTPCLERYNWQTGSDNPYGTELYHLWSILRYHKEKLRREQIFLAPLRQAFILRNKLAHYEIIEFAEYEELLRCLNGLMVAA